MKKTAAQLRASRRYNQRNKDIINQKSRERARLNPAKRRVISARYRARNREKLKEYGKKYYQKNKEKIKAKAKAKYLRLKNEKEVKNKMFGTKKTTKKEEEVRPVTPEKADLVIQQPETIGMQGFTQDAPAPAPEPAPIPVPTPMSVPIKGPEPTPKVKEQYQVIAAELLSEGTYRYVIVTNKNIGEVGGVYDI